MDGKRFDELIRLLGSGASRRDVLKGLFGVAIGSYATLNSTKTDARTLGTRPTVPPPPPPASTTSTTLAPTTTTPDPCPASAGFRCGRECCSGGALQCCDGECCGNGNVCLTRAFDGESELVKEETCCPALQTCDGQCCEGTCFDPGADVFFSSPGDQIDPVIFERECCPSTSTVCIADVDPENAVCCNNANQKCCIRGGTALCIDLDDCCDDTDCTAGVCDVCSHVTNQCVDNLSICTGCSTCSAGDCVPDQGRCGACEDCVVSADATVGTCESTGEICESGSVCCALPDTCISDVCCPENRNCGDFCTNGTDCCSNDDCAPTGVCFDGDCLCGGQAPCSGGQVCDQGQCIDP